MIRKQGFDSKEQMVKWLTETPTGREVVEELLATIIKPERWRQLLTVQHSDHVKLYGEGILMHVATQIHTQSNRAALIAEDMMEHALPFAYKDLYWPGKAKADRPGYIGSVTNRRLTVPEYEWWQAYRDNIKEVSDGSRAVNNGT